MNGMTASPLEAPVSRWEALGVCWRGVGGFAYQDLATPGQLRYAAADPEEDDPIVGMLRTLEIDVGTLCMALLPDDAATRRALGGLRHRIQLVIELLRRADAILNPQPAGAAPEIMVPDGAEQIQEIHERDEWALNMGEPR